MKKEISDYLHFYINSCEYKVSSEDIINIKLILRPLSDMTEEEAKELAAIYTGYRITYAKIKDGQIIFNYLVGDQVDENVMDLGYMNGECFVHLLSKGFDIFNLIPEGIALNKTKVMKDNKIDQLSGSEAVYGFAAWLTCRDNETVMSAHHDSAPIAELVKEFCETNNLDWPREDWHKILIHPPSTKMP